jgi:hypothetical protein
MLSVEDDDARSPLLDADGNSLSHSDAQPRSNGKRYSADVPTHVSELSEQEQIAWAEKAAEELRRRVLQSEARDVNLSKEEKN